MIPSYVKDQILEHDIVSIIEGEGIELKRKGANYECCCPFHNEKTPSFKVSPTKNIYKCFGQCDESGNAITFIMHYRNMTYSEALEYLADKLHIQYEKKELTLEEREQQYLRNNLIAANKDAQEFFRHSLQNAPAAGEYIAKRSWKDSTVDAFGIGYAPGGNSLLKYMTGKGWKIDILMKAGLIKKNEETGSYYDTFRQRIIFPIHSRTGYIAGFSGRDISGKSDIPKYLNTAETDLFHKGDLLFGWFNAQRQIATSGTVVLCEGNPDVVRLHEIGEGNTVAPLGTALTERQISMLQKKARTAILIGDTDEAGIKAVIRHGEELTAAGMSVRVMSLPEGKDPDEFFMMHAHEYEDCLSRNTRDYIPWYCDRLMEGKKSQSEIASVIQEISRLLALCKDETAAEMYLELFSKTYRNGKQWTAAYYNARNEEERKRIKDDKMEDMLKEYGFYIKDNCYYGAGSRSNDRRWSNFILQPILHIRDERNARRIFRMCNVKRQEAVIKFNQSELVSFTDFKTRTETAGNFVWEADSKELTVLKKYLYDGTPSADEIRQMGWQKKWNFYAWGNGGLDNGIFEKADEYGVVTVNGQKFYIPGCSLDTKDNATGYQLQRRFVYAVTNDISLHDFAVKLITVFGDNAKVALCFLFATLFKDIVTSVTTSFPILNLFGPKGTGKSELGHSLTSFFIPNNIAPNINNTTKAALAEAVAEVSNAIVHLDEYKNNLDLEKREFLKGLWDGAGRSRMNMDNDKRRETTAVDCGVVMSGQEMPTADIALFNRLIFLTFSKSTFSDQEKRDYEDLKLIEKRGLTHLTGQILTLRNYFQGNFRSSWDQALADLNDRVRSESIEDRTLRNWTTVLAAFRCLEKRLDLPFGYMELLEICARKCVDQNNKTRQNNELSEFWEMLEILVSSSKMWIDVDYHIRSGLSVIKVKGPNRTLVPVELSPEKQYLYLNFRRTSQLYAIESKSAGRKVIPSDTLKYYLEHSPEHVGTLNSWRFKQIETSSGYMSSRLEKISTAMVFDYSALKENYDINLDVMQGYQGEESGQEQAEATAPPSLFSEIKGDE